MKKYLSLIFLTVTMLSCKEKLEKQIVSSYPNGTPMQINYLKKINGKKIVVKETRFYPNGEKSSEGDWTPDNQKTGLWTQWNINGKKWIEENYQNGLKNGETVVWQKTGEKEYRGEYKDDSPSGKWTFYDAKGKKIKDVNY